MHVLETQVQRAMGVQLYGRPMLAHLDALGILTPRANLVHAVWLEPGDVALVAARGAAVVHNPVGNARLGSGICRLPEMLQAGVRVALGTGQRLLQRRGQHSRDDEVGRSAAPADPGRGGTGRWPAACCRWRPPAPPMRSGSAAPPGRCGRALPQTSRCCGWTARHSCPCTTLCGNWCRAETGAAVDTVLVAGQVVLRGGACTLLDEAALWEEARALSARRLHDNRGVYRDADALAAPIRRMRARLCGCAA